MYVYNINDECYEYDFDYESSYDLENDNDDLLLPEEILREKRAVCSDISYFVTKAGFRHDLILPELYAGGGCGGAKLRVYYFYS